jgi:hypothetical protein
MTRRPGQDLWELYHDRLGFLLSVDPSEIGVRTTYIERTKHVASGVLAGMDPSTARRPWAAHAQPQLVGGFFSPRGHGT